jgi:hypothetical protein
MDYDEQGRGRFFGFIEPDPGPPLIGELPDLASDLDKAMTDAGLDGSVAFIRTSFRDFVELVDTVVVNRVTGDRIETVCEVTRSMAGDGSCKVMERDRGFYFDDHSSPWNQDIPHISSVMDAIRDIVSERIEADEVRAEYSEQLAAKKKTKAAELKAKLQAAGRLPRKA